MREIPTWITNNPVVLNVEYLETSTMTRNKKNYK